MSVHARARVTRLQPVPPGAVRIVFLNFFVPKAENDQLPDREDEVEGQWHCKYRD